MKHIITITDKDITGSEKLSLAKPRIAVNAVLFDADNNIAISYMGKYDLHTLPGGGVEPLEDFISAVKREVWEEAGCECEIITELGSIFENRYEHDFTQERYYYIAKVVGGKGSLHLTDEEISDNTTVIWIPINEALKIISEKKQNDYQQKFIQKRDTLALTEAMMWLHTHDVPEFGKFLKHIQWIDGIPFKLKAYFDFSFISEYGKVFKVYDDQDSGNICFGVTDGKKKYFIKFAGAPTDRTCISAEEAIANLKRTVQIYRDLAHKNLVKFIHSDEAGGGFMMIFEWTDAECMHKMYPLSRKKFMQMPNETRYQVFDDILDFQAFVVKQGYIAIDFYDGSIMYDFNQNKTVLCDIDLFDKAPYINHMGRMWGSSRFMSPEEFQYGAVIDEITTVYTMGATAFALFGDESDRCFEKWRLSRELFEVAKRAVSDEREKRQQSIEQLSIEWKSAR